MVAHVKNVQGALTDYWDWQAQGLCNKLDPEVFFHPEGERGGPRRRRIERAKAICAQCPVIAQCREYALDNHEPYGVWGGLSEEERADILRARTFRVTPHGRVTARPAVTPVA
ncbi:MAG: WhiB family transcriptional regulator [Arcanobacterium sp.]|nr:WhiB family transcriptional regulator [Arcanobacterium sp.]MDY5588865.1 WhiB family transcriptional regulator [Arcanobacterium sp.]